MHKEPLLSQSVSQSCSQSVTEPISQSAGISGAKNQPREGVLQREALQGEALPREALQRKALQREALRSDPSDVQVMEEIEESKAFYEVYDGAVYMFQVGHAIHLCPM